MAGHVPYPDGSGEVRHNRREDRENALGDDRHTSHLAHGNGFHDAGYQQGEVGEGEELVYEEEQISHLMVRVLQQLEKAWEAAVQGTFRIAFHPYQLT